MKLPISSIHVTRSRFREELGDIEELASSLIQFNQLVPVVVDDRGELLDGFRRLTAAQLNGWTEIEAVQQSNVTELLAREIELETNLQRQQFTWLERDTAIVEIDRLRRLKDPNWTNSLTAALVGGATDKASVSRAKKRVEAIKLFPEIANAENPGQALRWAEQKSKQVLRVQDVKDNPTDYQEIEEKIWLGDSVEVIKQIPNHSFHAIITDPPFGVDYGERIAGTVGEMSAYTDDKQRYTQLLTMAPDLYRVLKPNGWLIWFFGMSWYAYVKPLFRDVGFAVDEIPVMWDRSAGRTFTNQPSYLYPKGYDVALSCRKGEAVFAQRPESNVIKVPPVSTEEREALVERPVELYQKLIQYHTIPGEIVADFFVGSGSCLAAAASLHRDYFGVELDPERRALAIKKIKAWTAEENK
jgi:site-specific DNA-methyltransferase (adenine-specific)